MHAYIHAYIQTISLYFITFVVCSERSEEMQAKQAVGRKRKGEGNRCYMVVEKKRRTSIPHEEKGGQDFKEIYNRRSYQAEESTSECTKNLEISESKPLCQDDVVSDIAGKLNNDESTKDCEIKNDQTLQSHIDQTLQSHIQLNLIRAHLKAEEQDEDVVVHVVDDVDEQSQKEVGEQNEGIRFMFAI